MSTLSRTSTARGHSQIDLFIEKNRSVIALVLGAFAG
jgi:hypothetical protein